MINEKIVFDFDGVLLDSSTEIIISGFNLNRAQLVTKLEEVDDKFRIFIQKYQYYARNAGETATLVNLAHNDPEQELSQSNFDKIVLEKKISNQLLELQQNYFAARRRFISTDRNSWLKLNYPCQPLWQILCQKMQNQVTILTYKNSDAVYELCNYYDLTIKEVYSIPSGTSKAKILRELSQDVSILHYIDDAYRNLTEIRTEISLDKINLMWATWGYGFNQIMQDESIKEIRKVEQKDLIKLIESVYDTN